MAIRLARKGRLSRQRTFEFYLGISPWLLGFLLFTGGPLIASLVLSFSEWDIISSFKWVGFRNYVRMLTADKVFWVSLRVTAFYSFVSVPLRITLALFLAILLNQPIRGRSVLRTVFYLPAIISGIAVAILWMWIFDPQLGLLNSFLWRVFKIEGPAWIYSEQWVIPSFILMSLWSTGSALVIFLAGLQGVPRELYEVAEVDGANWWRKFLSVTLPMISPVILFNLIMGIIGSFQVFTPGFVMTEGGPLYASLFMVLYLYYKAFRDFKMGYASTLAWALFSVIFVLTIIQLRISEGWVYYAV